MYTIYNKRANIGFIFFKHNFSYLILTHIKINYEKREYFRSLQIHFKQQSRTIHSLHTFAAWKSGRLKI